MPRGVFCVKIARILMCSNSMKIPSATSVPEDELAAAIAQAKGTPMQGALETLAENQLSSLQEYLLLNMQLLFSQNSEDAALEDALMERMDGVWWKMSSEEVDEANRIHSAMIVRYHEIFEASEAHRQEELHRVSNEEASMAQAKDH